MSGPERSSAELKRAKRAIRREVLALRDAIEPSERARLGALAAARLLGLPEVSRARTAMAFWSFGSELPMAPVIERLHGGGVTVLLPRIEDGDVVPVPFAPDDETAETHFGAREPMGERVADDEVDVIVTPAVAFDPDGRRVGYGGGFYDRFFPRTRPDAFRVGVGYDVQVLQGPLPAGAFDLRVHAVVTPTRVLRCPPG